MDIWQKGMTKIAQRGRYLLESSEWSDCKFLVGQSMNKEMVRAHKIILAMASPMFGSMFFGSSPEESDPILLPDVRPGAFKALLKYIYTDELFVTDHELAIDLYYCAKKYMFPAVVTECTNYLGSFLSPERVFRIYDFAKLWEETDLQDRCVEAMRAETRHMLTSESWKNASRDAISILLKQSMLEIDSELDLYDAVLVWSRAECQRKSLPTDRESLRSVAGDLLNEIRFLTLTAREFAEGPGTDEFLDEVEMVAIATNILSTNSNQPLPEGFSDDRSPRRKPNERIINDQPPFKYKSQKCCRRAFGSQLIFANEDRLQCCLAFKVNTCIQICGVAVSAQLPIFDEVPTPYRETLYAFLLDSDGNTLTDKHFVGDVRPNSITTIRFIPRVDIKAHKDYRIGLVFNKPGKYPAIDGCAETEVCAGVNFSFDVGPGDHNMRNGLIRGILFSK